MDDTTTKTRPDQPYLLIMNMQLFASLVATIILFRWMFPDIFQQGFAEAVLPVALLHMFRFVGMTLLMPGQADDQISRKAKWQISIGDLVVAITAMILSFVIIEGYSEGAIYICTWIFIFACFADMANVQRFFINERFWNKKLGVVWLFQVVLTWPMLLGEMFVFYRLILY